MQFDGYSYLVQTVVLAGDTIANTTTATPFATKLLIPANTIVEGQVFFIRGGGSFTTPVSANRQLDLGISVSFTEGDVVGVTSVTGVPTLANNPDGMWRAEGTLIMTRSGDQGLVGGNVTWTLSNTTTATSDVWVNATVGDVSFDTTINNWVTLFASYGTAHVDNSITMRHLVVLIGL